MCKVDLISCGNGSIKRNDRLTTFLTMEVMNGLLNDDRSELVSKANFTESMIAMNHINHL